MFEQAAFCLVVSVTRSPPAILRGGASTTTNQTSEQSFLSLLQYEMNEQALQLASVASQIRVCVSAPSALVWIEAVLRDKSDRMTNMSLLS